MVWTYIYTSKRVIEESNGDVIPFPISNSIGMSEVLLNCV